MLQIILFVLAAACLIALVVTRKLKGLRAKVLRMTSIAMVLGFAGGGISLVPTPLTADNGVQRANFIGTDMSATEELMVIPLEAYSDGSYILIEEAEDGQFVRFTATEDGQERRIPSEEVVFTSNEIFSYEAPVIRYGRSYLSPGDWTITFMGQRWDFVHLIVSPENFGIWAG